MGISNPDFATLVVGGMGKSEYREKGLKQLCRTKNESHTQTLPTYDFEPEWHWWALCNKGTRSNKGGAHTSLIEAFLLRPHTLLTFVMPQTVYSVPVIQVSFKVRHRKGCHFIACKAKTRKWTLRNLKVTQMSCISDGKEVSCGRRKPVGLGKMVTWIRYSTQGGDPQDVRFHPNNPDVVYGCSAHGSVCGFSVSTRKVIQKKFYPACVS